MKQIIQNLRTGEISLEEIPVPKVQAGCLLVRTSCSLISPGTERMLLEFGRGGWLAKARQQPDKVKQVLDKIRTDGLAATFQSVQAKLDQPIPMGYSNVGRVLAVGDGVTGFGAGDRVVSNGPHAEVVMVPRHLAARVPDGVADEEAGFTVLGAVALQGVRLVAPTLGETVAVFGLGLIGLLAVQILRAHGARVLGFDCDARRTALAGRLGADAVDLSPGTDPVAAAGRFSDGMGIDGVLVTAATQSDELMHQAAQMCRRRGRIVLTGVTGLNLRRADFYEKELSFQVSCSYGPGRYDPVYEEEGCDYPLGFVRWTEQRNFQAVLTLLADRRLVTAPLVSRRVPLEQATDAYEALVADKDVLGVILDYPPAATEAAERGVTSRVVSHHAPRAAAERVVCGLLGAGSFAQQMVLPALGKTGARLKWVATSRGFSGAVAARRFGIEQSTTEVERVFEDPEVNAVVIATRHESHAGFVLRALQAGQSVFVEKPLCLNRDELSRIVGGYGAACESHANRPIVMVGFNRRFAPLVAALRSRLQDNREPLAMIFTCNAGAIPADHWTQDPAVGGGRVLGEVCHFVDLLHFLAGEAPVTRVAAFRHGANDARNQTDTVSVSLQFADGSLGQINYFANGAKSYPKERLEVFAGGQVHVIENFRRLRSFGRRGTTVKRLWSQDKGHRQQFRAFVQAVREGAESPIRFASLVHTASATLAAAEALCSGRAVDVPDPSAPSQL